MIPADVVRRARLVELRAKKNVGSLVSGAYRTMLKGRGVEFLEVREYVPGDDTRSIDWNVTARTGRPYLKRYAEERERTVMLLMDVSASHRLGSGSAWKSETTAELFALLALAAIYNGDDAGLILFAGGVERYVPPTQNETYVLWLIREVLAFQPRSRGTSIGCALDLLCKLHHRRSLVFLISDFLDQGYEAALRLCARQHDLVALPVFDPREVQLPDCGLLEVEDPESGARAVVDTSDPEVRAAYEGAARDRTAGLRATLQSAGVDHLRIAAGSDYFPELMRFLRTRR